MDPILLLGEAAILAAAPAISVRHWHSSHKTSLNLGGKLADGVAMFMGSWRFIIIQTVLVILWMLLNVIGWTYQWDVYPFIALNLLFSTQAAYAAPIIMMSQNRQADRDRHHAEADYKINLDAKDDIERLQTNLARIELDKLDQIIVLLKRLPPV